MVKYSDDNDIDVQVHEDDCDKIVVQIEDEHSDSDEEDEELVKLTIYVPDLLLLRYYLTWTTFLIPSSKTARRLSTLGRFLVFCGLFVIYPYDLGAFKNRTLVDEELKETLNAVKNACWSLRFVVLFVLGWAYFSKRHLEKMLSSLKLTQKYWKKAQKTLWKIMTAIVLFVFVVPLVCRLIQMQLPTRSKQAFDTRTIVLNLTLSFLSRFFGLPVFVAFVYAIYLTYTRIRLYKHQIQRWPRNKKEKARAEFMDIMALIQKNEKAFQKFLLFQVGILLVVLIPAVLSFAERINNEGYSNETYVDAQGMQRVTARPPSQQQTRLIVWSNVTEPYKAVLLNAFVYTAPNVSENQGPQMQPSPKEKRKTVLDKGAIAKVAVNALGLFFEMLVLCSLPLFLLAKVSKVMAQLPETVQMLKFETQKEEGYMIQSEENLAQALKFLTNARGFRVLGMDLTTVKVALITLVMPFLTTVIHLMMAHVDITN